MEAYYARDRRVYNGAMCSDMLRQANHEKNIMQELKRLNPNIVRTYFPMEDCYLVSIRHENGGALWFEAISEDIDKQIAMLKAIEILKGEC